MMNKVVWKANLSPGLNPLSVPEDAEFLTVAVQYNQLAIWFKCDPSARSTIRKVLVIGTGHQAPNGRYIGTVLTLNGELVLHVFEDT